ncbi:MAG: hypothetical protein H6742_07140 [Alphaproteobacteria bacterium]|nr:hypothetical protein [Alphaproteobacteria bacterium]
MSSRRSRLAPNPLRWPAGALIALALGALLAACGARQHTATHAEGAPWKVDVALSVDARTSARRLEDVGPDLALDALFGPLGAFGVDLDLVLDMTPSRTFRDGSLGWLVVFERAQATVRRPGQDPVAIDDFGLQGRAVELRTFGDGEILVVDQAAAIGGADRMGDVLDVLWPLLSPAPPSLDAGQEQGAQSRWPLMVGPQRGWRHTLAARWRNEGQDDAGLWHLAYDGPVEVRGQDRATSPWIGVRGRGQAEGRVTLGDDPGVPVAARLVDHDLTLTRTVEIEYPHADGGPLRVTQEQRYTAHAVRRTP